MLYFYCLKAKGSVVMNETVLSKRAQKTREKLLETSLDLMKKKGYQSTTVRDICAQADISVGTFYSYFPSKTDLFFDIYKTADDYFSETVAARIKGSDAKERILDFFKYYAKLNIDTGIDLVRVLYNPENSWFIKKRPMHRLLADIAAAGLARKELITDKSEQEIVNYLFTLARGCCYNWCIADGKTDLTEDLQTYISMALEAF